MEQVSEKATALLLDLNQIHRQAIHVASVVARGCRYIEQVKRWEDQKAMLHQITVTLTNISEEMMDLEQQMAEVKYFWLKHYGKGAEDEMREEPEQSPQN